MTCLQLINNQHTCILYYDYEFILKLPNLFQVQNVFFWPLQISGECFTETPKLWQIRNKYKQDQVVGCILSNIIA